MMTCASASMMTCMITTALHDDLWASLKLSLPFANTRARAALCRKRRHHVTVLRAGLSLCRPGSGLQRCLRKCTESKSTRPYK